MTSNTKVYCETGRGNRNISSVVNKLMRDSGVNLNGYPVLIKANTVVPDIPEACSNPARIQMAAETFKRYGLSSIYVGDDPATDIFRVHEAGGRRYDSFTGYRQLQYTDIDGVSVLALDSLPPTSFDADVLNPLTYRPERRTIPVRDTSALALVSFSMPKQHGQFNFSGASKNLMGLVPPENRLVNFHHGFINAATQMLERQGITEPSANEIYQRARYIMFNFMDLHFINTGENRRDPRSGNVSFLYNKWLTTSPANPEEHQKAQLSLGCYLEMIMNEGALTGLVKHINRRNPPTIHVMDGTYLLRKSEHGGTPRRMDFALASLDPIALDMVAMYKTGVNLTEVPYLTQNLTGRIEFDGNLGPLFPQETVLNKEIVDGLVCNV
jgi:uncharacterized protein (DUF362 family)